MAEWLALFTSVYKVAGSNIARGRIQFMSVQH